jgi:protein-L-isoaspartate(D-aspartate) O-methyltransferase
MSRSDVTGIGMTSQRTRDRLAQRLRESGITNERVLAAVAAVPRHAFVDEALAHRAYEDTALPIGHGQTISQPFTVALMTQTLLDVPRPRVLEVGTGSGYQTAILARMRPDVRRIFTIERLALLSQRAEARLAGLRITGARFRHGDGYEGWPEEGPFDGILVTAAPPVVPEALLQQLKVGGRLVVPVGGDEVQELKVVDRTERGFRVDTVEYVRFVPLVKGKR